MTPLLCPACGAIDVPRLESGTSPHAAKAVCRGCGRFLKWLPKVLVRKEDMGMDTDLNHVTLTGTLERDPMTRFGDHGAQQVSFTLRLTEAGPAGQEFKLFVPIEAYGQAGELAGELSAGDAVLVAGKLKWTSYTTKDGAKKSTLAVMARHVKRLTPAAVEVSA
jgi:Single-strand binding protein family